MPGGEGNEKNYYHPFLILLTLAPVTTASNKEDISLLEAIEVNPDFSELIQLRDEIIKLYQIDPKVEELREIKKQLELSQGESRAEILALQKDYTTLQNYSSLLAMRYGLENTYFSSVKELRNSMIISLLASTVVGILTGILISRKWKRKVEYLSVYTRKAKIMHPGVYACEDSLLF